MLLWSGRSTHDRKCVTNVDVMLGQRRIINMIKSTLPERLVFAGHLTPSCADSLCESYYGDYEAFI